MVRAYDMRKRRFFLFFSDRTYRACGRNLFAAVATDGVNLEREGCLARTGSLLAID